MKNLNKIVVAALVIAASAVSCTKEMELIGEKPGKTSTITLSLDNSTKTALSAGKTVWSAGDKILITDGTVKDTVVVSAGEAGTSTVTITGSKVTGTPAYAIYPITAAATTAVADGKVNVKVPADQSGLFEDANICVAKSDDFHFNMKNAAAIMKVSTLADGLYVVLNASGDALSGNIAVEFGSDGSISNTTATGTTGIVTCEAPTADDYYIAVAAGTYKPGFSIMAVEQANGNFETKATVSAKTLAINDIANLGSIGDSMSGFAGAGTEGDPYKITSIGEMIALANAVNVGNDFAGKFFKVMNDIATVTLPVGYYNSSTKTDYYFKGDFDGDNKTITLNLDGANCRSNESVALFGDLGEGANIHNVTVDGIVTATGSMVAGIAGCINAGTGASISNCKNLAAVTGKEEVGGIVGYGDSKSGTNLHITDCRNEGAITGVDRVGGIGAYIDYALVQNNVNVGNITSTSTKGSAVFSAANGALVALGGYTSMSYGTGGVVGYGAHTTFINNTNNGNVDGYFKVAGICGCAYWSPISDCTNTGNITATANLSNNLASQMGEGFGSLVGGIAGYVRDGFSILDCSNSGTIKGNGGNGGIAGMIMVGNNKAAKIFIERCKNSGSVISTAENFGGSNGAGAGTGGIAGAMRSQVNTYVPKIIECENTGAVTLLATNGRVAAGIVGTIYRGGSSTGDTASLGTVNKCINKGTITAGVYASGIVGYIGCRRSCCAYIWNCENSGTIIGNRTNDYGECAAGILGGNQEYSSYTSNPYIDNCLNTGDIKYADASHKSPYCGGIAGNIKGKGRIQNCFNNGTIQPVSGSPVPEVSQTVGALAGCAGTNVKLTNSYYDNTVMTAPYGTNTTSTTITLIEGCDDIGEFAGTVTYKDVDYTDAVSILNAWVSSQSTPTNYYTWVAGPAFDK